MTRGRSTEEKTNKQRETEGRPKKRHLKDKRHKRAWKSKNTTQDTEL